VNVVNFSFSPSPANIAPGGTVTWVWASGPHSVTTP
jgi:plastocyanin